MRVRETTPPEVEPVDLQEAKTHLRVDHDAEDGEILRKLKGARVQCEKYQGRAYIARTLTGYLDEFPSADGGLIHLPKAPASAINSVKYWDPDGVQQTLDPANYEFDPYSEPARLRPVNGGSWPATGPRFSAVAIEWEAGYGDDPTDVPEDIKAAIKLLLGDLYENREDIVLGLNANSTGAIFQLLAADRIFEGINQ